MSRALPFPTYRQSPSHAAVATSPSPSPFSPSSPSGARPIQISRPDLPIAAGNNPGYTTSQNAQPSGPSRPQRSELRNRASDYDPSESTSHRDSVSTTRSVASLQRPRGPPSGNPNTPSRPRPQRLNSPVSDEGEQPTPASLTSALSAFKSAGARRRAMTDASDSTDYHMDRQSEIEAEKVRQQRIRDRVPGRRIKGSAPAGNIDAVLDQVKDGWEFILDPDFNNVDLALLLLEDSGQGKDMESFRRTKEILGKALKGSVDKHYQAFAASLPHRATLLNHLTETQSQIQAARTAVLETKDLLGNKRADLIQLRSRGQTLDEMIRILDEIEHLRTMPDLLETLISEKRLLQAAVLLMRSLKVINKPDMLEIGAVADLRSYLNGQETALREILVDELHNHLYLRSFWCDNRWSPYVPGQQTFPAVEFEEDSGSKPFISSGASPYSPSFYSTRQERFINDLSTKPNEPPIDLSDLGIRNNESPTTSTTAPISNPAPTNPEADSFVYMESLIESLAILGKLGNVLDSVAQRLPSEIFSLVESTIAEAEERAEYRRKGNSSMPAFNGKSEGVFIFISEDPSIDGASSTKGAFMKASRLRLGALESSCKKIDHEIVKDLFWTLYSKLDAFAQGLRVIYEVANRVGSRRDFKDSSGAKPGSLFPLAEAWVPVQMEVRTLIRDYLIDEDQGAGAGRNPISSINEILREGKFTRDRSKAVFRFADTDMKITNKVLKPHEDGVTRILNDTMPGLVPGSSGDSAQSTLASVGVDDRLLGVDQHHRLLTRPDPFHVTVLFQPTLAFFSRIAQILPPGVETDGTSSSILDEFISKVYLPQLEEKVSDLFHQAVTGLEAFQPDPLSTLLSPKPLMKASTQLLALINSLCAMLHTSPFHQENYARLILGVIIQFYQRCSDRFQDLVSNHDITSADLGPTLCLAAQWSQRPELNTCISELLVASDTDRAKQQQLCRRETHLELELLGRHIVTKADLIPSLRHVASLASLYHSVTWFATELTALKSKPDDVVPAIIQHPDLPPGGTPHTAQNAASFPEEWKLPLSQEMSLSAHFITAARSYFDESITNDSRFQALLKTYEQLSSMILNSIHIDIRCRTIFFIHCAMAQGDYSLDFESGEPDTEIVDLNVELMKCDDMISSSLPAKERQFVFMGLGHLMEHMVISNARYLCLPTAFSIRKILRNIAALQQTVKALTNDTQRTEFDRAKRYYSLFFELPQDMLNGIRNGPGPSFTFDEYQTMLKFQCGVNPEEQGGVPKAVDRNYSMYVIDLHGLELESSDA